MLLTKAEMARRTRGVAAKSSAKITPIDYEKTATMVVGKKRSIDHRPPADPIDLEDNSSYHQGSSEAKSCKKSDKVVVLAHQPSSWPKLITLFDQMAHKLVRQDSEEAHKVAQELAKVNKLTKELKTMLRTYPLTKTKWPK